MAVPTLMCPYPHPYCFTALPHTAAALCLPFRRMPQRAALWAQISTFDVVEDGAAQLASPAFHPRVSFCLPCVSSSCVHELHHACLAPPQPKPLARAALRNPHPCAHRLQLAGSPAYWAARTLAGVLCGAGLWPRRHPAHRRWCSPQRATRLALYLHAPPASHASPPPRLAWPTFCPIPPVLFPRPILRRAARMLRLPSSAPAPCALGPAQRATAWREAACCCTAAQMCLRARSLAWATAQTAARCICSRPPARRLAQRLNPKP